MLVKAPEATTRSSLLPLRAELDRPEHVLVKLVEALKLDRCRGGVGARQTAGSRAQTELFAEVTYSRREITRRHGETAPREGFARDRPHEAAGIADQVNHQCFLVTEQPLCVGNRERVGRGQSGIVREGRRDFRVQLGQRLAYVVSLLSDRLLLAGVAFGGGF